MIITRRAFTAALSLTGLAALAGLSPFRLFGDALAQGATAADVAKPVSLPDMALGPANATVTMTEYASMTCPHCAAFHATTFQEIKKRYIDTGKVRFIFREFALNDIDLLAIVVARCAPKERYLPLVETLYEKQEVWAVNNPVQPLLGIAKQAGFTDESFKACASNQKIIDGVKAQREAGSKFGVNSTPTFFINGEKKVGGMPIEEMEKLIQPYLKAG